MDIYTCAFNLKLPSKARKKKNVGDRHAEGRRLPEATKTQEIQRLAEDTGRSAPNPKVGD